ncbi:hypothetical protein VTP01DRAFT_4809 [Rhizomucor pusillus]|uniref:uncharacterized protein n=1 Tax=Rhizomucor pusillus TaxID=4840 RepID=UPI003743CB5B
MSERATTGNDVYALKQCVNHNGGNVIFGRDIVGCMNIRRIMRLYMDTGLLNSRPASLRRGHQGLGNIFCVGLTPPQSRI